jgi:hypothetical protein
MATARDTARGKVFFFEDFLYDVVADKPEYSVGTDPAVEIVATGQNGIVRTTMDAGQSNVDGMSFGQLQWNIPNAAGEGQLSFEMRVRLSAIGTAAERIFMGFTDVQEDTLTEMPFTIATTVLTPATDPDDAIGFMWEGDASNGSWYPASQASDSLRVDGVTNVGARDRVPPVANEWQTLKFVIYEGAKVVTFSIDGKEILRYDSGNAAIADVPLTPYFVVTEGTAAINFDVDYVYVEAARIA